MKTLIDKALTGDALSIIVILAIAGVVVRLIIWYANVNSDRSSFKEFMTGIENKLEEINKHIIEIFKKLPEQATAGASPLELTDFGHAISEIAGAKKIAKRLSEQLREELAGKADFEIQAACEDYMKNRYKPTADEDIKIKKTQYEKAVSREVVLHQVIMIELRDKLMELAGQ